LPADLHVDELRFGDEAAERDVLIAVHLRVFWPISPISATQEPRVILGFRDGARGLRTTQTALSGHVWLASLGRCSPPGLSAVHTGQYRGLPAPYPVPFWLQRVSLLRWLAFTMAQPHLRFRCP
jgi:hypothetical protein